MGKEIEIDFQPDTRWIICELARDKLNSLNMNGKFGACGTDSF